ncbi:hypothetical protein C3747_101g49 [Trypanosoma cruzi]|uniref:Enriched in surface-labeled proteome protein 12 n=2 Tax=Trypanosoma cruzi TaxID=5693 RepID=Q4DHW8_TRYCC|nr:hypothetical protein, conserved [Trypanosoma cruzi]EAN92134.1 hypothetical protein, conserved [Trypanosoma cruzi]KAF5214526.1 Enriched in surface-labeled proteome protein 12 [Trypanosoma cruzi]KAF5221887.1 Enriched in surface-labeled proteome protein 12 [Trypanosoma cruzi]KAF8279193.1 Enriched in surface-labeled proteome protein 12 [Trypanosoma cruzi]PWV07475.1 hypothetical protein C3747_101g49 [Trypanosoma cruzi]|eukprot:XP_813985.1 hypothetical protein [Trypanosoma cruzi strain CL Brener]
MKRRNVLLFAFVLLLNLHIVPFASAQTSPSTSEHIIVFGGPNWEFVVQNKLTELKAALIKDIGPQLLRKYAFLTIINVSSVEFNKNLRVHITVLQALLSKGPSSRLLHLWPPDEANSMITQGAFSNTLALYPGPERATVISVQLAEKETGSIISDEFLLRLFKLGYAILSLMAVLLFIVLVWMCCQGCGSKPVEEGAEPYPVN